jgi:starvation-inducible DNA-binding protein
MYKEEEPMAKANGVAADLQAILVDLIALSLQSKQAHWNVRGPLFRPLHELFDEITDSARGWYDEVAERNRAIGAPADGRPSTVAEGSKIEDLPAGEIPDRDAVVQVLKGVEGLAGRIRGRLDAVGRQEPISQDLLIGIVDGLEKHAWMLRAHQS